MARQQAFFEVDLDHVVSPQLPDGGRSVKGYSRQEIDQMVGQLSEVQRLGVERGYAYEHFSQMRASADPAQRALGETHHKFYDHSDSGAGQNRDYVKLAWDGQRYQIDNGLHRVASAKRNGLRVMPASVSAEDEHMAHCRSQGFASPLLSPSDRGLTATRSTAPDTPAPRGDVPDIWEADRASRAQRSERGPR